MVGAINLHRGLALPSCWSCRAHTVHAVLPHTAFPRAVDDPHSVVPPALASHPSDLNPRPQLKRAAASWGPKPLVLTDAGTPTAHPATGALLGQVMLSMPIIARITCADFRCAPGRFRGLHLSASPLTGHRRLASLRPPNAGAQTDLSSSVFGCANVSIPLRRRRPRGCNSKLYTVHGLRPVLKGSAPSRSCQAAGVVTTLQDSLDVTDRLLSRPPRGLCRDASTPWISPRAGHQLHGCLVTTAAGLPPASRIQLLRTH